MNIKRNPFIFIVALVLVIVLIGLPSMRLVQKLSAGCPLAHNKMVVNCSPCLHHTMVSPIETGDLTVAAVSQVSTDIWLLDNLSKENNNLSVIVTLVLPSETTHLRC